MASLSDRIRAHVTRTIIASARERGVRTVRVKVGEVEREMGLRQRAPTVCRALQKREFLREQGLRVARVEGPPSGLGPRVVLTYRIEAHAPETNRGGGLRSLRGLLRGAFDEDGGGEAWLRKEREQFYEPGRER